MQREVPCAYAMHLILSKGGRIDLRLSHLQLVPKGPSEHTTRLKLLVLRERMLSLLSNCAHVVQYRITTTYTLPTTGIDLRFTG